FDNYFSFTLNGSGTLHLNGNGTTAEINAFAASPLISAGVAIDSATNATITYSADTMTLSGALSGTGNLTKLGAGILSISGAANPYSGSTTISAGTAPPGHRTALQYSTGS